MSTLPPKPTQVFFIVDESGSMCDYSKPVREAVASIIHTNLDPVLRFSVIAFSGTVDSAPDVDKLSKPSGGNTVIAPAFKKMHSILHALPAKHRPERVVIAFISDGQDDNPTKCVADLKALPALQYDSILLTIGVNPDFPTGLVVDVLRPKYHKGSFALPPVLPVRNHEDLSWAFGQLEAVMLTELAQGAPIPAKVDDTTSTRAMIQYVRAKYNECAIRCAESARTPQDNLELLNSTVARMHEVALLARARVIQEKAARSNIDSGALGRVKPLLSNLLSSTVYNPKTCLTFALSIVQRLNAMIASASKGQLMSELSDDAKKELIGYAYTEGKHITVASKYRAANFFTTRQSLVRLLRSYSPKEADRLLPDPINLADQAEYFSDAREHLLELIPFTHTLPGILKVLPFVGRTLTFKEPLPVDALQVNEWLAEVVALPMVHRHMTTYDYYETFKESFSARGETVNGLMVLGGDPLSPGIFHHVQSMLLLKHPGLFVLTARLAVAASVLTFILCNHRGREGWMDLELQAVREVCANYPPASLQDWHSYMEDLKSGEHHLRCLVPEAPRLPKHCKCPGLTKYLLALYLTIAGGHRFTLEELKARHFALVTEFLARCKVHFYDHFHNLALTFGKEELEFIEGGGLLPPSTFLETVWAFAEGPSPTLGQQLLQSCISYHEARDQFTARVEERLRASSREDILAGTTFHAAKLFELTHYQLSLHRIGTAFAHLGGMSLDGGADLAPEFTLSKPQLIRALHTVQTVRSAYDRSVAPAPIEPMPRGELESMLGSHFQGKYRAAVMGRLDAFVKTRFEAFHSFIHAGLARPIPQPYVERFREEFGLDIGVDWAVGAGGLSTLACCLPNCPHFMELLETPRPSSRTLAERSASSGRHPAPVVCRKLRLHLSQSGAPAIPGFHKTVSAFQNLSPEHVAAKITCGECLGAPHPTSGDMAQRSLLLHRGGTASDLEALKSRQEEAGRECMLSALQRAVSELSLDDPTTLAQRVSTLQGQLASPPWPYDDFRALFVAKYKSRPDLTAHLAEETWPR